MTHNEYKDVFKEEVPSENNVELSKEAKDVIDAYKNNDWKKIEELVENKLKKDGRFFATHEGADYVYLSSDEQIKGTLAYDVDVKKALDIMGGVSVIEDVFNIKIPR